MIQPKLYAKIVSDHEVNKMWTRQPPAREDGWYEIEREPGENEYLEYDEKDDCIVIKKREKSTEELEAEKQADVKRQLVEELPDIILQNKDDPAALAQALCDRAKQIEVGD